MKLYVFTKKDIDRFLIECNFTPDEEKLFRLRCKEYTLEYCVEQMNASIFTAKRLSRRVNLTTEMSDMSKDAECREERDLVKRYVEKLRDML